MKSIDNIIDDEIDGQISERQLAIGYLRYEALRKLNPIQYFELWYKNLKGENFDEMVDKIIMKNYESSEFYK